VIAALYSGKVMVTFVFQTDDFTFDFAKIFKGIKDGLVTNVGT